MRKWGKVQGQYDKRGDYNLHQKAQLLFLFFFILPFMLLITKFIENERDLSGLFLF